MIVLFDMQTTLNTEDYRILKVRKNHSSRKKRVSRDRFIRSCLSWIAFILLISSIFFVILSIYFLFPSRMNLLILGIDYTEKEFIGRSDTIIGMTIVTTEPKIDMISIPRDLWVTIPSYGENRINAVHFFAEANETGSGPEVLADVIKIYTGVNFDYFIRIRFDGLREIIDAMGGLDIILDRPMAGYEPGKYHLNGKKTLAFIRHRAGYDDFFRMENGGFIIRQAISQLKQPSKWLRLPKIYRAVMKSIDTNIPKWLMPRLGLALLRVKSENVSHFFIDRNMVTPYITDQGANVLLPNWELIIPLFQSVFEQ